MERLLLGEPTEIIGLRGGGPGGFSVEDHLARIERAALGSRRFKERLRLIQGGGGSSGSKNENPDAASG